MKKKKRQRKVKFRFMRDSNFGTMLDSRINSIQASLNELSTQLGILKALSKGMECVEAFTKERLATQSRDNLRIENLKKLFRLAYGNDKFASMAKANDRNDETLASFQRRMMVLKNAVGKILADEGIRPIAPSTNEIVSESEHRIVQTVASNGPECQAGCVAECLEIGFAVHGVITPAEVTVFAAAPTADGNMEASKTQTNQ